MCHNAMLPARASRADGTQGDKREKRLFEVVDTHAVEDYPDGAFAVHEMPKPSSSRIDLSQNHPI